MTPCDVTRILLRCSYSSAAVAAVEAAERRRAEVVARDMARKEAVLGLDAVARSQATGPGFHGGGTTYYHEARPAARCRPAVVLLSAHSVHVHVRSTRCRLDCLLILYLHTFARPII